MPEKNLLYTHVLLVKNPAFLHRCTRTHYNSDLVLVVVADEMCESPDQASSLSKNAFSPLPNKSYSFVREPPDGCEKVNITQECRYVYMYVLLSTIALFPRMRTAVGFSQQTTHSVFLKNKVDC